MGHEILDLVLLGYKTRVVSLCISESKDDDDKEETVSDKRGILQAVRNAENSQSEAIPEK